MVVQVKDLVKRYGQLTALDHLSFDVREGEIFGLLGPNGSGKTTAINCILALLEYEKGTIEVFGRDMSPDAYDVKRNIGVVMQNVAVYPELNVYENIDYFCGLYVTDKKERRQLVDDAIRFVGLEDYTKFVPKKLSGGLLRRLNIACGIAHRPRLIILDEPTVAVDPQSRNHILEGIQELNRQGATIIYTSHYMEEVEQICTRILILDKGKDLATGSSAQLKDSISYNDKVTLEGIVLTEAQTDGLRDVLPNLTAFDYRDGRLELRFGGHNGNLERLLDWARAEDIDYTNIYSERPTLNDVFLEITGKELRD